MLKKIISRYYKHQGIQFQWLWIWSHYRFLRIS